MQALQTLQGDYESMPFSFSQLLTGYKWSSQSFEVGGFIVVVGSWAYNVLKI